MVVSISTGTALASFLSGHVARSATQKVQFNIFYDLGLSWAQGVWTLHEVEGLDVVRQDLVRRREVQDLPILIRDPPTWYGFAIKTPQNSRISLENACLVFEGIVSDGEDPPKRIGKCYLLHIVGYISHEDLLALIVATSSLSRKVRHVDITNPASFRATWSAKMRPFRGIVQHFDPIWSPDGKWLLFTVWEDGRSAIGLLDPSSRTPRTLARLTDSMAARPVWSPDSRYVAVASLKEIRVADVRTGQTWTIPLAALTRGIPYEMLLRYDRDKLVFAFDTNALDRYKVYTYDPARTLREEPGAGNCPKWTVDVRIDSELARHASVRPVLSPTGKHVALIRRANGLRRIEVQSMR